MNFNTYLKDFLQDERECENISLYLVIGCMEQYLWAETEDEKDNFLLHLKNLTVKSGVSARNLFVLYDVTKEVSYKEKIEDRMDTLRSWPRNTDGIFCEAGDTPKLMPWEFLYEAYPFYMAYETHFHNKADYAAFVLQMRKFEPALINSLGWEEACFLMTLIDVLGSMSKEIFEHYKSLEEIFKRTVKKCIPQIKDENVDLKVGLAMGYVIAKACNMKVLNSEKYIHIGLRLIADEQEVIQTKDSEVIGLYMMADSVRRQFTNNE